MKKKSIIAILLTLVMCFSLSACGGGTNDGKVSTDTLVYGDEIEFGSYEQNNNSEDGAEPIKWVVAGNLGEDYIILLSFYGLDMQPYNDKDKAVTWETCTLRTWLNDDFYNTAFTDEDKALMSKVNLENPDNSFDGSKGGADTQDLVWLFNEYDARNQIRITELNMGQVETTAFAQSKGAGEIDSWWLRSPNGGASWIDDDHAATVAYDDSNFGEIYSNVTDTCVVRPVIVLHVGEDKLVTSCEMNIFGDASADKVQEVEVLDPAIGMTEEEVLDSTWGEPDDKNVSEYEWGTEAQWVYDGQGYIYFENGIVDAIQYR